MQESAVRFLHQHLFQPPMWLMEESLTSRLKAEPGVKRIADLQERTLNNLYSSSRLQRLIEAEAAYPNAYGLEDFFTQMEKGIWSELNQGKSTSVYRRNLQKLHLEKLVSLLKPGKPSNGTISTYFRTTSSVDPAKTDIKSLALGSLVDLQKQLDKRAKRTGHRMTRYHFMDCAKRIEQALKVTD